MCMVYKKIYIWSGCILKYQNRQWKQLQNARFPRKKCEALEGRPETHAIIKQQSLQTGMGRASGRRGSLQHPGNLPNTDIHLAEQALDYGSIKSTFVQVPFCWLQDNYRPMLTPNQIK